ncbi:PDDEXK family nuclease [Nitrococcus mobilis]|uniref:hypothetical protein n=1 Tax=Nitrococcus mobilis TaxID=35797 RepID=UPI00032264E4
MSPAPARVHQRLVVELLRQIADALEGGLYEVNVAPFDVRLPEADEADEDIVTVLQSDITVVCDPTKLDAAGCRRRPGLGRRSALALYHRPRPNGKIGRIRTARRKGMLVSTPHGSRGQRLHPVRWRVRAPCDPRTGRATGIHGGSHCRD